MPYYVACCFCRQRFPSRIHLERHFKSVHRDNRKTDCLKCSRQHDKRYDCASYRYKPYVVLSNMEKQKRIHPAVKCPICSKWVESIESHMKAHEAFEKKWKENQRIYEFNKATKKSNSEKRKLPSALPKKTPSVQDSTEATKKLKKSVGEHNFHVHVEFCKNGLQNEVKAVCPKCQLVVLKSNLDTHLKTHPPDLWDCNDCGVIFEDAEEARRWSRNLIKTQSKTYLCFNSSHQLQEHHIVNFYECYCGSVYSSKVAFESHRRACKAALQSLG